MPVCRQLPSSVWGLVFPADLMSLLACWGRAGFFIVAEPESVPCAQPCHSCGNMGRQPFRESSFHSHEHR